MRHQIAGLVVLVAVLATSSSATASRRHEANHWPAIQERAFLANCNLTSRGKIAMCRCELRWLERRYTYQQMAAVFLSNRKQMVAIVLRATAACIQ